METTMYKVLVADKLAQEGVDVLNSIDGLETVVKTGMTEDELCEFIGDFDGLIIRSATKVTPKVLDAAKKLKGIARAGVGVDNINIPEATKRGVIVMNTPGGNTLSAAEHTMALMLSLSRNVVPACNSLKEGAWDRKKYMGSQLNNKVLGIIGMGRIGMAVCKMATGFGMKIIGYDPFAVPKEAQKLGVEVTDSLEKIYKESDYISLHIPGNEKTTNLISADQIKMMKPNARIVNCARGGIINEDDLYDALKAGTIAGAAIDVFPTEPPENTRFQDEPHCLVTPHLGASTEEAQVEVAVEAAKILADAIMGGPIANALNAPSISGKIPPIVSSYATLAERIGVIMSTIATGHIKSVEVAYRGSIADKQIDIITTSFSIGLLKSHFDAPINMVNVGVLAKERGISIDVISNTDAQNVASSFTAKVVTDKITRTICGTVFGENLLRIIQVDGYDAEVTPEGPFVVIFNDDKPGVIGAVGTLLGKHGVNINTLGVGNNVEKRNAVFLVSLDKQPGAEAIKEASELDFVNEIYSCNLS
jgi:D-3-phosphoglycerate dehydrogenase